ncbi:jg25262, partial [Pararge aegeria aegeria]
TLPPDTEDYLKRSTSDGTIEENFEDALAGATEVYTESPDYGCNGKFTQYQLQQAYIINAVF